MVDAAVEVKDQISDQVSGLSHQVQQQVNTQVASQKDKLVDTLETVSLLLHQAGEHAQLQDKAMLSQYVDQAAHTDDVIANREWEAEAVGRDENTGKPFALRYIITHLIAETARHNGHLDILRELADGVTGD